MSTAYKAAGVDVEAGYEAVKLMKEHVNKTFTPGVLSGLGGFGGLFELGTGMKNPVLVSGTDGVGTKLRLAFLMDKHDTIGQDCVAMCANDIACSGAKPLFFLDYLAVGKNVPTRIAEIVKGVADGCLQAGAALIGGETAEMPGFYEVDEYDLAGFCVGVVDKDKIVDGTKAKIGDVLVGIGSSGVHSNGYSLVRKIFNLDAADAKERLMQVPCGLDKSLGETLLMPTKIYVKALLSVIENFGINAVSHITGGGFYENIPRMLPEGLTAYVTKDSFDKPAIFSLMAETANLTERDLYNTFNMGIGLVVAVDKEKADGVVSHLKAMGESAYIIGEIKEGSEGVVLC
ncbi:MAG: phosphoribosylformylglycinamidine cyclo-ligase [Ruminococcaceae bacterium]|nr:phosphoribosylformylglycinamidine cyclo-ligase [Oscillospiraceae bacterium]